MRLVDVAYLLGDCVRKERNAMIRKCFLTLLGMGVLLCSVQVHAAGTNTIPYLNSMEDYPVGYAITNAKGWYTADWEESDYNLAFITNASDAGQESPYLTNSTHTNVLLVNGGVSNMFDNTLRDFVYVDMLIKPKLRMIDSKPDVGTGSDVPLTAVYFNTNGNMVYYFGTYFSDSYHQFWRTNTAVTVSTGSWCRLTFKINYLELRPYPGPYGVPVFQIVLNTNADLIIEGVAVSNEYGFTSPLDAYSEPWDPTGGTWFFACYAEIGGPGGQQQDWLAGVSIMGQAMIDDFVVADYPPDGAPQYTTNWTPHSWLASYSKFGSNTYDEADWSDADGDGSFAWQEYRAGTDPSNSLSAFRIISVDDSQQVIWLGGTNIDGYLYFRVYRATNLLDADPWGLSVTNFPRIEGDKGTNTWTDLVATNLPAVFYKVTAPTNL